jgi:hypothetical protein
MTCRELLDRLFVTADVLLRCDKQTNSSLGRALLLDPCHRERKRSRDLAVALVERAPTQPDSRRSQTPPFVIDAPHIVAHAADNLGHVDIRNAITERDRQTSRPEARAGCRYVTFTIGALALSAACEDIAPGD